MPILMDKVLNEVINIRGYLVAARLEPVKIGSITNIVTGFEYENPQYRAPVPFTVIAATDLTDMRAQLTLIRSLTGQAVAESPLAGQLHYYRCITD